MAVIDLDKSGRYHACIWFLSDGRTKDLLSALYRDEGDPPGFTLEYRFRYYAGPNVFDGKDKKKFYRGILAGADEEGALAKVDEIMDGLVKAGFGKDLSRIEVRSADSGETLTLLLKQPWFQVQTNSHGGDT
jgi:hypothetical protein